MMKEIAICTALLLAVIATAESKPSTVVSDDECSQPCPVCPEKPTCAPGVSLVPDKCGCCKKCARQLNEPCDANNPCDIHKNHYCGFGEIDEQTGICLAKPGRSCYFNGETWLNGHSFQPNCKVSCLCVDGDIACVPQCPTKTAIPKNCVHPRLVHKPGKCCEEWICEGSDSVETANAKLDIKFAEPPKFVPSRKHGKNYKVSPFGLAAHRPAPIEIRMRTDDGCMVQTTPWSACSKTCGWGVSERVSNDNSACKLKKQTRLCQIRPCENNFLESIKKGKKCIRTPKAQKPVRYSFSGCKSKVYKPKYCGECTDGRCCTPSNTKTVAVKFHCDGGFHFTKRMMVVKSCKCHTNCGASANDIFSFRRNVGKDTFRS